MIIQLAKGLKSKSGKRIGFPRVFSYKKSWSIGFFSIKKEGPADFFVTLSLYLGRSIKFISYKKSYCRLPYK